MTEWGSSGLRVVGREKNETQPEVWHCKRKRRGVAARALGKENCAEKQCVETQRA